MLLLVLPAQEDLVRLNRLAATEFDCATYTPQSALRHRIRVLRSWKPALLPARLLDSARSTRGFIHMPSKSTNPP